MKKHLTLSLFISAIVVILDQISKLLVIRSLRVPFCQELSVIENFFSIVYVTNKGSIWGIFQGSQYILAAIAIVVVIVMLLLHKAFELNSVINKLFFGMLVGGIVGNTIDRIFRGCVIDFLHFYVNTLSWPSFNIADIAISLSCSILLIKTIFKI